MASCFLALGFVAASMACSPLPRDEARPGAAPDPTRAHTITHLTPARDFVGRAPRQFSWTAVKEADSYAIGVWSEVDVLQWRLDHVDTTSVNAPEDIELAPGTYFWSVSALREGRQIAESGLAAFMVRTQ